MKDCADIDANMTAYVDGEPVSLFVVPGHARREQLLEIVGHDAVIWSERDNGYVLVAEHGPVDIAQIADYVRRSTE